MPTVAGSDFVQSLPESDIPARQAAGPRPDQAVGEIAFKQAKTKAGRTTVDGVVIHTMEAAETSTTAENVAALT